jgi:hypothetical protein
VRDDGADRTQVGEELALVDLEPVFVGEREEIAELRNRRGVDEQVDASEFGRNGRGCSIDAFAPKAGEDTRMIGTSAIRVIGVKSRAAL